MNRPPDLPRLLKTPYLVAVAALAPIMKPYLPLNSEIVDYVNVVFMVLLGLRILQVRRIRTRLAVPAAIILAGSLIAMFNSPALGTNLITIVQEVYLYMFFVTLYNVIEHEDDLAILSLTWTATAVFVGVLTIRELRLDPSVRAIGPFENPNMAASYLGISAFFVFQPFARVPRWLRALLLATVLGGMIATKSLSALLACSTGLGALALVYVWRSGPRARRGAMVAAVAALCVLLLTVPYAGQLRNFLERAPESIGERAGLWRVGLRSFIDNPLGIGVGPAGFEEVGFVSGGIWGVGIHKSLHSDYLSFLVERGVIGFSGLLALLATLALSLWRSLRSARDEATLRWSLALLAMFVFTAIDALTHEVMHYRHVWLAFGLIAVTGDRGRYRSTTRTIHGPRG